MSKKKTSKSEEQTEKFYLVSTTHTIKKQYIVKAESAEEAEDKDKAYYEKEYASREEG